MLAQNSKRNRNEVPKTDSKQKKNRQNQKLNKKTTN